MNEPDRRLDAASAPARRAALLHERSRASTAASGAAALKGPRAGVAPMENVNLPQYCYDHAFDNNWWGYRTEQCQIVDVTIYIWRISPPAPPQFIGTAKAVEFNFTYSTYDIDTFAHQIRVTKYWGERWGNIDFFSRIYGHSWCTGDCKQDSDTGFRPGRFAKDVKNDGEAFYDSTRGEPGGVGYGTSHWEWQVEIAGSAPSTPIEVDAPQIRCDNALEDDGDNSGDLPLRAAAVFGAGCVFPRYVPVMVYSKTGFYPTLATHIGAAQNSGLPGAYPQGTYLTRLTDKAKKKENGDTACPRAWKRPDRKSCDEYPFRSTYQGAAQPPKGSARTFAPPNVDWCEMDPEWGVPTGVTGPTGWSSCMIDATDNSLGGSALGAFYKRNRVLDKDPFLVWIQP